MTTPKKKKAVSRKTLQNRLDVNWSKAVKIAAGYKCQMCGMDDPEKVLNSHHLLSRKYKVVRWDLANGVCLCYKCHRFKAHGDDYLDQCEFHKWLRQEHSFKMWDKYGRELSELHYKVTESGIKPLPMAQLHEIDTALKLAVR